jgi:serine/threonine-protein kinase RsbT
MMMMTVKTSEVLPIRVEGDVVMVRQRARAVAVEVGLGLVDVTKLVTATSELARNALIYGGGGTALIEVLQVGVRKGVRVTFEDQGPGIPDIAQAMTDGWTSGNGMGLGLSGAKRLSNEFEITSAPGQGTRVMIARWK